MKRTLLNKITLALAVIGCIIALVLSYEHFFPAADIGCSAVGGNCHTTIESKYGKLGPIPTSVLGLGMYLTLAGLCVLRARSLAGNNAPGSEQEDFLLVVGTGDGMTGWKAEDASEDFLLVVGTGGYGVAGNNAPGSDEKPLGVALFGISLLAFCISWWLQYVSFFVIFSFCPWCFASALTVTAIFLVNAYDYLVLGRTLTGEQKMLTGVLIFIGAMFAFMYAPQIFFQVKMVVTPHSEMIPPPKPGDIRAVGDHPRKEILGEGLVFKGKPTARYTIVEFADYACNHCKDASEMVDKMVKQYPDLYRVGFRNFPLGKWPWSIPEAEAAEAAAKQGKFWEMHDLMFAHQSEVDNPLFGSSSITAWAKSVGLDIDRFKTDMTSSAIHDRVIHDHDVALINNVTLTPTFFIVPADPNGKIVMIIGGEDAKTVLSNPNDPFWNGNLSTLKNHETPGPLGPPPSATH